MSVSAIIISGLAVGGTGILIGFILGIFGEKFKVEVDEREEAILEVLPGNNCGGCGYAGCVRSCGCNCERRSSCRTVSGRRQPRRRKSRKNYGRRSI